MNKSKASLNIEKLKEGLTYQGKQRIDNLIKNIKKSIRQAESENIKVMRYHLMSQNNEMTEFKDLLPRGLTVKLFDLNYVEYTKKTGKMGVKARCKWLKDFLTVYRSKFETKSYEV